MKGSRQNPTENAEIAFEPTKNMQRALQAALDPETPPTITAIFKKAKLSRDTWYDWCTIAGFNEWWDKEWKAATLRAEWAFDKMGMQRGARDFNYYKLIQGKYFNYREKAEATTENSGKITVEFIQKSKDSNEDSDGGAPGKTTSGVAELI